MRCLALAFVAALAMCAGGCGGDDGDEAASTPTVTAPTTTARPSAARTAGDLTAAEVSRLDDVARNEAAIAKATAAIQTAEADADAYDTAIAGYERAAEAQRTLAAQMTPIDLATMLRDLAGAEADVAVALRRAVALASDASADQTQLTRVTQNQLPAAVQTAVTARSALVYGIRAAMTHAQWQQFQALLG